MIRRLLLLSLFAAAVVHADEREQLVKRLHLATVAEPRQVGVYDRYASGRPRLVIAATHTDDSEGEVLLIRLPDASNGSGKILHREKPDEAPYEISFIRLVDPKDVSVECYAKHGIGGVAYRVRGERLVEIANDFAGPLNTPDLDGDGIPEIIWIGGHDFCGNNTTGGVLRWNGTEYAGDGRHYAVISTAIVGAEWLSFDFHAPAQDGSPQPSRYILHVHRDSGVSAFEVKVDEEVVLPETPLSLENDCHTLDVTIHGKGGAMAWAMIEQRP